MRHLTWHNVTFVAQLLAQAGGPWQGRHAGLPLWELGQLKSRRVAALQAAHLHQLEQLSCPVHPLITETLQHSQQEGWHWCAAAPGRCHTRRTEPQSFTELHHLPAQAHPRTHSTAIDKDKPLAGNCNSDREKVTFIVYLSLGLAVFIIAVVSAAVAMAPAAAQSVPSSIVFSSNAPKSLQKTYRSKCKWLTMVKRRDKIKWIQLAWASFSHSFLGIIIKWT